jgi:hypothetical protein
MRALLLALLLASSPALARKRISPRDNLAGLITIAAGALTAVVGAILVGYGSTIRAGGNCPGWPDLPEVCNGLSSDYRISGWTLFGAGLTLGLSGGIVLGVQAR